VAIIIAFSQLSLSLIPALEGRTEHSQLPCAPNGARTLFLLHTDPSLADCPGEGRWPWGRINKTNAAKAPPAGSVQ
jgi:hypothetical protein